MVDIEEYRIQVEETAKFLRDSLVDMPEVIIQLGTGLGGLVKAIDVEAVFPYEDIPHFPSSTVESHAGNLFLGKLGGKRVAVLQGRFHFYEGYSTREVAFPIRVLTRLGAGIAIITNASGGLNKKFEPGTIMVFADHLNMLPENPLRGPNIDEWGPRFPDLSIPYDSGLRKLAYLASKRMALENLSEGVYVCIPGPSLETPAETRFLKTCGADAVGMSSVPEILVALHGGLKVLGLSVVANCNDPDEMKPIILEEIVEAANAVEPKLQQLIIEILRQL